MWSNQVEANHSNYVIHTDISDHYPIISSFKSYNIEKQQVKFVYRRMYGPEKLRHFVDGMSQVSWEHVYASYCPDDAYEHFIKKSS